MPIQNEKISIIWSILSLISYPLHVLFFPSFPGPQNVHLKLNFLVPNGVFFISSQGWGNMIKISTKTYTKPLFSFNNYTLITRIPPDVMPQMRQTLPIRHCVGITTLRTWPILFQTGITINRWNTLLIPSSQTLTVQIRLINICAIFVIRNRRFQPLTQLIYLLHIRSIIRITLQKK